MRSTGIRVLITGVAAVIIGIYAERGFSGDDKLPKKDPATTIAVEKGMKWLVSVQGKDGGWGQDGGERAELVDKRSDTGESMESRRLPSQHINRLSRFKDMRPRVCGCRDSNVCS